MPSTLQYLPTFLYSYWIINNKLVNRVKHLNISSWFLPPYFPRVKAKVVEHVSKGALIFLTIFFIQFQSGTSSFNEHKKSFILKMKCHLVYNERWNNNSWTNCSCFVALMIQICSNLNVGLTKTNLVRH